MGTGKGLLYAKEYSLTADIAIPIPTLREVLEHYEAYYEIVSTIIATPSDLMVQLDDMGLDFTQIDDYLLFCITLQSLQERQKQQRDVFALVLGALDLTKLQPVRLQDGTIQIRDKKGAVVIDKQIHSRLCDTLRTILGAEKNERKPANEDTRRFMIDTERRRQKRALRERKKAKAQNNPLENIIVSVVNTAEFSYTFETVLDLSLYQFNVSVKQINNKIRFDNLMIGCYAGTVKTDEMSRDELNWMAV